MSFVAVTLEEKKEILELAFPLNIPAKMLAEAIAEKLHLPVKNGMKYVFLIKNQGVNQLIEPNKTFAEAGIFHGARLILQLKKVAREPQSELRYKANIIYENGRVVSLGGQPIIFGRNDLARGVSVGIDVSDLSPNAKKISRQHAKIEWRDGKYFLVDLKSTNGTRLNGHLISPDTPVILSSNDKIELGSGVISFIFVEEN